jgi:hypothetical protein
MNRDSLYVKTTTPSGRVKYTYWGEAWDRDSIPKGTAVQIDVSPGCVHTTYLRENISARKAWMIANSTLASEIALNALREASASTLVSTSDGDDERARKAHQAWVNAGGKSGDLFRGVSQHELVEAVIKAIHEAMEQMTDVKDV